MSRKRRKDLTEHEQRLVMSIAKLSKPGILRVLAAAGCVLDGDEATNYIGVPGCMGAAHAGPDGCTCRVRCCVQATDELAARWWGYADAKDAEDEMARAERDEAAAQRRARSRRRELAARKQEVADAIESGVLINMKDRL